MTTKTLYEAEQCNTVYCIKSMLVYQTTSTYWLTFVSFDFNLYSDIRIFFGGFTAPKILWRIRLAEFFSADIRRTKIRRLIQIFGGSLGSKHVWLTTYVLYQQLPNQPYLRPQSVHVR